MHRPTCRSLEKSQHWKKTPTLLRLLVWPAAFCECERWTLKISDKNQINASEMKVLRQPLRVSRTGRKWKKSVLQKAGVESSLLKEIKKKLSVLDTHCWKTEIVWKRSKWSENFDDCNRPKAFCIEQTLLYASSCYPRRRLSNGSCFYICLSVFPTISQKPMQLGSPNLTQKCSTTRLGVKKSKVEVTSHNIAAGCVLKPRWVSPAAMPRSISHATITGFSLRHFHAFSADAARH